MYALCALFQKYTTQLLTGKWDFETFGFRTDFQQIAYIDTPVLHEIASTVWDLLQYGIPDTHFDSNLTKSRLPITYLAVVLSLWNFA